MVTTTMVIHQLTATTTIRTTPTATIVAGSHSNTNFRLCILRNTYSKGISIKEIYSFLNIGKHESIKCVLVGVALLGDPMQRQSSTADQNEHTHFYVIRRKMNEVFLIGKIIEKVEYKFMLEKNKTAKAKIKGYQ